MPRKRHFCHPGGVTPYPRMKCAGEPRQRRGTFFIFTTVPLWMRDRNCRSAGILFSVLPEKSMQKRGAGCGNSAYARKGVSFRCANYRSTFRRPNALRATVKSGFPSARQILRVATSAPVEYLTYGSRDRRRVFRLPRRAFQYASLSRFLLIRNLLCTNQPSGMIQEGGISPLLGRFKGIPKGEIEIPLWRFLFTPSGFFFAAQRKRG